MQTRYIVAIDAKLTPVRGLWLLAALFCLLPMDLGSEDFSVTTYYPPTYVAYNNAHVYKFIEGGQSFVTGRIMMGDIGAMKSTYGSVTGWASTSYNGWGIYQNTGNLNVYASAAANAATPSLSGNIILGSGGNIIITPTAATPVAPMIGKLCSWVPYVDNQTTAYPCQSSQNWTALAYGKSGNTSQDYTLYYQDGEEPEGFSNGAVLCCRIRMNCGSKALGQDGSDSSGTCANFSWPSYATSGTP